MDINRKQRNDVLEPGDIQCIGHNTDISDSRPLSTAFSDFFGGVALCNKSTDKNATHMFTTHS